MLHHQHTCIIEFNVFTTKLETTFESNKQQPLILLLVHYFKLMKRLVIIRRVSSGARENARCDSQPEGYALTSQSPSLIRSVLACD